MADGSQGRVPPNAIDAEAAVLCACLLDDSKRALDAAKGVIDGGDFYSDANRWVWQAIVDIDAAGNTPDAVLVAKWLRANNRLEQVGGTPYLAHLSDATPAIANVAAHAQIVADKSQQRRILSALRTGIAEGVGELEDVRAWGSGVVDELTRITARDVKDPPESFRAILPRVIAEAESRSRNGVVLSGVDTGFRDLNEMLGGWKSGKIHVVGGRPGMGKSSFLLCTALAVGEQGSPVLFASAEMTKEELTQRALAVTANLDVRGVTSGKFSDTHGNPWSDLSNAQARLAKIPFSIFFKPGMSVSELRTAMRTTQRESGQKLGLVVVDYLQILDGKRAKGESREGEVSRLSRELMWLAQEMDVPIILASQLNRSVESRNNKNKRPTMADLRESGAIEQDAYTISLLYRDEYYDRQSDARGIVEVIVGKHRNGPTGTVLLAFHGESTRIDNLEENSQPGLWEGSGGHDNE